MKFKTFSPVLILVCLLPSALQALWVPSTALNHSGEAQAPLLAPETQTNLGPQFIRLLDLYGLAAVFLMMFFYFMEGRKRYWTLAFALACGLASSYGFLQGAWPFGIAEGIWALLAIQKWQSLPV
jgi:hypothetical protein